VLSGTTGKAPPRTCEVAFSDNVDLYAAVISNDAIIAAYATRDERPSIPFWPMLFDNATIRLLGSDDFPAAAKQHAARDLTALAAAGGLVIGVAEPLPLAEAARAHDQVDADNRRRVLLAVGSA
jgi:NADPH2:quinone reductase